MAEDIEIVRKMCERCLAGLEQLLRSVKSLRGTGTDATKLDIQVRAVFETLYREYEYDYERLSDTEPEPWYLENLCTVLMDFEHADHVVGEQQRGLYSFGWPWEECIAEWTSTLNAILERLPK